MKPLILVPVLFSLSVCGCTTTEGTGGTVDVKRKEDSQLSPVSPAKTASPIPRGTSPSDEKRRASFETLKSQGENALTSKWREFIKKTGAKILTMERQTYSYYKDWRGGQKLSLTLRFFGFDADVDRRIVDGLKFLKLPQIPEKLKDHTVDEGLVKWSLILDRVVAPAGSARQTQVKLTWHRRPKTMQESQKPCGKFNEIQGINRLPGWLLRPLTKTSTRRRIRWEVEASKTTAVDRQFMVYHNGFSQDENVGLLVSNLKAEGFQHVEGSGPKQVWRRRENETVRLHPAPRDLDVGCRLRGPVLEITWSRKAPAKK